MVVVLLLERKAYNLPLGRAMCYKEGECEMEMVYVGMCIIAGAWMIADALRDVANAIGFNKGDK